MKKSQVIICIFEIVAILSEIALGTYAFFFNAKAQNAGTLLGGIIVMCLLMALFQYFTPAIFIFLAIKYFNKSPKTSVTLSSVSAVVSAVMFPLAWYLGLFAGVEGGTHRSYAYLVFIFMLLLAILELVLSLIQKKNKAAMKII